MRELAAVTYLLFAAYVANLLMLAAVAAKQANRPIWLLDAPAPLHRLTGWVFRIAFTAALLWPPVRLLTGGVASDPLARMIASTASALLGHLFVVVGAAIALLAQYLMGSVQRGAAAGGQPDGLVQTGPYALSRNPLLLGQAILFAGLFLAFPDLVQALISATVLVTALVQVHIEERALEATFGAAYEDYAARVPRWIGRVRPAAGTDSVRRRIDPSGS
jgi:protein-S-isoprenylcysteine O-methyltransferase Ste14